MHCTQCASDNPVAAKFCSACGAPLELRCGGCGHANAPGAGFCNECGKPLGVPAHLPPPERLQSPRAYTPKHLAEKILTSRDLLEGERKLVTVLFADIKGSMELILDRDPEDARQLIDPVLDLMMEAVHRYEGTVNQVTGDGVMALFGAPLAHEDHAIRACYTALAMQDGIRRYNEALRRSHGIEIQVRVGLNSGEVVVRAISTDLTMEYSAVGQTTHLAARMEQLAVPGTIRLTAETLRLAEGFVRVNPLGPMAIKGVSAPMEVFELLGASTLRTRVQVAAARGLTPFIGRRAELEALAGALERSHAGKGELMALVGEPGVGKSRLVWELTHSHRTRGWLVLESGSVSYGRATAYRPMIDLLKTYLQVEDRDDARRIREKVTGKLLTLDKALESTLPVLLSLLDVAVDDPQWMGLHPTQRRLHIFEACRRLILRESQVQPLVLVFEDLHWIDTETQAFLDGLLDSLPSARIMLLVNYRPEYRHSWGNRSFYTQLHIDPLPADSADELLLRLLGGDASLEPLRRLLVQRTEGNPFFLEESVRSLVEAGALTGERGHFRLSTPLAHLDVPTRVQAILAARIDRLSPQHKRLLQTAAVVGKDVPFALLKEVADLSEDELREGLAQLQAAEFLYETSLFPDLEYTFKHALTHEVAYGSVLQERRRATHARIVDGMEAVYTGRVAEHVERIAVHALRGELWPKAVEYLREAGGKALAHSANAEAVAYLDQALAALHHLPGSPEASQRTVDLILEMRNALHPLGEFDRVLETLREAEAIAEVLADERRLGRVYSFLCQSFRLVGDYERSVETGQRAVAIGQQFGDAGIQATANFHLGQAHFQRGAHGDAIAFHRRNLELTGGELRTQRLGMAGLPGVFSRGHLAWCLAERGEFEEAIALWDEALRISLEAKHPYSQAFAEYCGGFVYLRKGELENAIRWLERGVAMCQSMNIRLELPFAAAFLGNAYALAGRIEEGSALARQAVDSARAIKLASGEAWLLATLGEVLLAQGSIEEARERAQEALDAARSRGESAWEAWSLLLLGEACAQPGNGHAAQAAEVLEQALAQATRLGLNPLRARCELSLGSLYRARGDTVRARRHLESSREMLTRMGMGFWAQRAISELNAISR